MAPDIQPKSGQRHGTFWDDLAKRGIPAEDAMEGRFVRLFELTSPTFPDDAINALADAMTADAEDAPTKEGDIDDEENRGNPAQGAPGIEAAYTYFGQFIDHDLTFDPNSNLRQRLDERGLKALINFRTPRFDLDNLYGRGPNDQPYLYADDAVHFALGAPLTGNPTDEDARDLPRGPNGRALIGDPRNDENRIVAQLHSAMLRFHNAVVEYYAKKDHKKPSLDFVQQQVRWHYQWLVVDDFLKTIINADDYAEVFPNGPTGEPEFRIARLGDGLELMPVEFSVAAYRFGHSMIRPIYRLNETISRRQIFNGGGDPAGDLGGMRPIPDDWAIDWQFFIDLRSTTAAVTVEGNDDIKRTPQFAYKMDTSLVNPLAHLPEVIASDPSSLTLRNLERGVAFGLPSGQQVAAAINVPALAGSELVIGKATKATPVQKIADIHAAFASHAPLWTYVLSEAQVTSWKRHKDFADEDTIPIKLGPVGGHLVAETMAAILKTDKTSIIGDGHGFRPIDDFCGSGGTFGIGDLLRVATSG